MYYAQWTPAAYTVTWPTESGFTLGGTPPTSAAYGGSITFTVTLDTTHNENAPQAAANGLGLVPTAISGDTYTYVINNITEDMTVTVIATADATPTYNVSFRNNYSGGALEYYSVDVVSGNTITAFEAPSREGYTFDGWYPNADGSGTEYAFADSITADSVYYAQWTPATYTVTWPTESGFTLGGTPPTTAAYGGSITFTVTLDVAYNENAPQAAANGLGLVPTAISGDTYTYVINNITEDTTVTVIATADATPTYNVSFRNNYSGGALEYYSVDVVSGNTITAFEAPSREGYTFDGWYPNADGSGTEYAFADSITADSVYYAQWTPATYTVTWPTESGFTLGGTLPATAAYGRQHYLHGNTGHDA